jgi:hypothetical protein
MFAFVATMTVQLPSPVRAESACIEQPTQPAPEGARWSARYDRAKARKCWFLLDANGRDVTASHTQPSAASTPAPSLSSQIASLLSSLTGATANEVPQANTPPGDAAQISPAGVPRKRDGNTANANKNDNVVRADQKTVGEGRAVKRTSLPLTQPEREALFEEFLRWQENQRSAGSLSPWPSSR